MQQEPRRRVEIIAKLIKTSSSSSSEEYRAIMPTVCMLSSSWHSWRYIAPLSVLDSDEGHNVCVPVCT